MCVASNFVFVCPSLLAVVGWVWFADVRVRGGEGRCVCVYCGWGGPGGGHDAAGEGGEAWGGVVGMAFCRVGGRRVVGCGVLWGRFFYSFVWSTLFSCFLESRALGCGWGGLGMVYTIMEHT